MTRIFLLLGFLTLSVWTCGAATAASKKCLEYEPKVVTLAGKISRHQAYGPPNFGETPQRDEKIVYWTLDLPKPICVDGKGDEPGIYDDHEDVRHLHIVYPHGYPPGDWVGGLVRITGQLFDANTAYHRTPVLITAAKTERFFQGKASQRNRTVEETIRNTWAPAKSGETFDQRLDFVRRDAGLMGKEKISDLTPEQLNRFMAAQKKLGLGVPQP